MIHKLFKQMVISNVISAMAVMLCLLIDSIMIGRFLGVDAMAAYTLANPVLLVFAGFGSLMSTGIQVVCSQAMGKGDEKTINNCFSLSIVVMAIFSFLGLALVLIFTDPLCLLLGAKKGTEVFRLTKDYLQGFILGAPLFIGAQVLIPYLQMAGKRVVLVVAVIAMTLTDIAFDLFNVYVLKKETFGMGLASSVSYLVAFVIGVTYFFSKKCIYKFNLKDRTKGLLRSIIRGGIPTLINQVSIVLLVYLVNQTLMKIGSEAAVAAYMVCTTIANLGYCVGNGISEVALMLTSIAYKEEDRGSLKTVVKEQTRFSIIINMTITILFLLISVPIVKLFIGSNVEVEKEAILSLRLCSLCFTISSINAAFKKYYQAIGKIRFSEIISVLQNFVFPGGIVIGLGSAIGTTGVWLYFLLGEVITFIFITVAVALMSGEKLCSADSYVCIPRSFGASDKDVLELEIKSADDIQDVVLETERFCKEHGETDRTTMYTALCIEEMANNIVRHGFKEKQDNSIDIRLVKKADGLILRIRDNCQAFNPKDYFEMNRGVSEDPASHIGIKMIFKMVKDVNYVNSLGLNSLTLKV